MDISLESDAEALWQDALDLLADRSLPEAVLAMLRNCVPVGMDDGVLRLETPMRLVLKTVSKNAPTIEECLTQAAFQPMRLEISFAAGKAPAPRPTSTMTRAEAESWNADTTPGAQVPAPRTLIEDTWDERAAVAEREEENRRRRARNPLVEDISEATSKLTFDRFVRGEENDIAYQAALQVANGMNSTYNPLFIYGKSGLGKTHLLRAIQNYIARNDPSRLCVYRDASAFITDYTEAMRHSERSAASVLRQNYADIDVLIIDDVQKMAGKAGTVGFFFDTFNELVGNGKQIVLAADRTPAQLGMGKDGFDERVTSRLSSGFTAPIQVPSYELKLRLIETFCERMRDDALRENVHGLTGEVPEEARQYMAERAGTNIRVIEGFCQRCLFAATAAEARGERLTREEIESLARECWPSARLTVSIEDVQKAVEKYYDIDHSSLIGNKRHKSLMEARHVAIWLSRELCDRTLADIGKHFGGRSHATIMHSISVVDEAKREDKGFYDRLMQIRESITGNV
ncbi:DnaA ATPase domain-containing protein [Olsenella profusa]|uniref:Chromosomal replication initiator protein DnaA n=1 Tax=Olsenella profusa TaxID=138595 RepID=A0ABS2F0X8_9ACTN|nr:DnaA/Hda family protein [Olsenella profusa]MBM6774460.1 AAA family ATPase [Olsenella profusa]